MTIESTQIVTLITGLVVCLLGVYVTRKLRLQDDLAQRVHDLELKNAANYGSRDAVDAAVARAMEPLRDSIDRQESKVDELSSLVLKLLHRQGID